jgi:hypothetical protein
MHNKQRPTPEEVTYTYRVDPAARHERETARILQILVGLIVAFLVLGLLFRWW